MYNLAAIQNIFREVFDDESLTLDRNSSSADIEGWDSVAQVKLVLAIEEHFGLQLSTEEVSSIRSVGGFLDAIERHTRRAA